MSITDKELLAICNLSNLKMEFANLKKDIETTEDSQGENYTNHTIGGDTYRIVLMNESANKFYLPKLKELFGENVLPILDINIAELSIYPEFLIEMKERMKAGRTSSNKRRNLYIWASRKR